MVMYANAMKKASTKKCYLAGSDLKGPEVAQNYIWQIDQKVVENGWY